MKIFNIQGKLILQKTVNIVNVDSNFDLGDSSKPIKNNSYLGKIIMEKNNSLNHFCNLGYQTFLNSQEEIDLLNKFNFESHRLGEIIIYKMLNQF